MSSFYNARNVEENSRRPSTTLGAKFRAPSSRVGTKERPLSPGEVIPDDSASNAPPRRSVSDVPKINGNSRTAGERQTGRVHLGTRENLQVRTRSPVKISLDGGTEEKGSWAKSAVGPNRHPIEEPASAPKERKKIREWGEGNKRTFPQC